MNQAKKLLIQSKTKLTFHKWAILLALAATVIIAFPQLYLRYDIKDAYRGVEILGGIGDERAWLSRVREVQDGHPAISNAYFREGKGDPYLYQPLGSGIIAYLGKIFSLDINNTILLFRLLFSFSVFLIIYGFLLVFTKEKLVALATSSFLFLGSSIFSRQGLFLIFGGEPPSPYYLGYTRPVNPLMTHLFFYGFLLCFLLFLDASTRLSVKKQWIWGVASVLILGLSFYDYFYTWTFLYAFLGALVLIFLFQKKWPEIKKVCLMIFSATLIAIPYLFNLYRAITWPTAAEVGQRQGLIGTHAPFLSLVPVALFAVFLLFFPRKWRDRYYFALALVIAPFLVLNQQIITGKVLQAAHYHWNYHLPLAIIFLSVIFFYWISRIRISLFIKTSAVLIIVVSIFTGAWVQGSSYLENKESVIEQQRYGPALNWLSQNAEKDDVVFSDGETSRLIVIYTPLNVFYHPSARFSLAATRERLVNTLFLYYRLKGIGKEEAYDIFFKDREVISWAIYGVYYRDLLGDYKNIPDELISELIQKYKESFVLSDSDFFKKMLAQYRVKYLVWDKKYYSLWRLDQYPFLEKTAEFGDLIIYQKF